MWMVAYQAKEENGGKKKKREYGEGKKRGTGGLLDQSGGR